MKETASSKKSSQSFLEGALILVFATIVVKIIGAIFKIPIGNLLKEEGFACFTVAYNVFTPLYSLAMAGLPVAVARMVSENATQRRYRDVRKILRVSTAAFTVTGALGSLIMLFTAKFYSAKIVETPAAFLSIVCLSPAVFFCCMMSSRRGYYEGLKNMYPTAISQMIEALAKLVFGLLLSWLAIFIGTKQFETTGKVFGTVCENSSQAMSLIYPVSSAAAITGVTLSTFFGALYLRIKYKVQGDSITRDMLVAAPKSRSAKQIFVSLLKIAIPVSLGTLATTITSFIDSSTVLNRLNVVMQEHSDVIISMYKGIEEKATDIPTFIYGSYGYGISIFNLVPTITTTFAISALPAVTSAWTLKDRALTKQSVESVLRITSLIAFPSGIGIAVLSKQILSLLYPSRVLACEIAAPALSLLGIAVIFVALLTPINSMLQAVGKADVPVKLMLIGGTIKILTNFVLVSIPSVNVKGAPVGTILCYIFLFSASIYILCRRIKMIPDVKTTFVKPFLAAAFCGLGAFLSYKLLAFYVSARLSTVFSIIFAVFVYALCLLIFKALSKDDIIMLPGGKKIAKILEKYKLIG